MRKADAQYFKNAGMVPQQPITPKGFDVTGMDIMSKGKPKPKASNLTPEAAKYDKLRKSLTDGEFTAVSNNILKNKKAQQESAVAEKKLLKLKK